VTKNNTWPNDQRDEIDEDDPVEAPETPTDEPLPIPIQDPPTDATPEPPMTV
jgi:hypothetical protein